MLVPTMQFEFLSSIVSADATTEAGWVGCGVEIPKFRLIYRQFQNSIAI